jgi:ribonucleoside-diphosphate reductase alpha chain
VLCEKFAHSRFEPSGWTGNEEIGYAKSVMDYIFRWLQLRFLSGQQLSLFAGLAPAAAAVPVAGVVPSNEPLAPEQHASTRGMGATAAPQGGIVSDMAAAGEGELHLQDRGVFHAADAMKEMYDMGDAPSCHTCGAIMVRNGSCYRCMSCGSTSGCS